MRVRHRKCSSCGADIVFVRMRDGAWMPCDVEGEVVVPIDGTAIAANRLDAEGSVFRGELRLRSPHWATCPNAAQHRRGR